MEAKYVLAKAHVVVWTPTVSDDSAAQALSESAAPLEKVRVARTITNMASHKKLLSLRTQIFTQFNKLTWPCEFRGFRITPEVRVPQLRQIVEYRERDFWELVQAFKDEYANASKRGLISHLWPMPSDIVDKFKCKATFLSIPNTSEWKEWFDTLRDVHVEHLRQRILEGIDEAVQKWRTQRGRKSAVRELLETVTLAADVPLPQNAVQVCQELEKALAIDTESPQADSVPESLQQIRDKVSSILGG